MAGYGTIGVGHMTDKWSQRKIFGQIWKAAVDMGMLTDPRVCPSIPMNKIRGVIPMIGNGSVQSQLEEFEHAETNNAGEIQGVNITLYKDRVRLGVSDEAVMDSDVGDPLMIQKSQSAAELAGNLDSLIATQIATTPQTLGAAVDWGTDSPLIALGTMINTLKPYKATAVVMSPYAYAEYVASLGNTLFSGGTSADLERGITVVPGYNLPVIPSDKFADASANAFAVVSNQVPGVLLGTGAIKIREWEDNDKGAKYWQADYWRTPISNLRQTAATNLGIVTGVHS